MIRLASTRHHEPRRGAERPIRGVPRPRAGNVVALPIRPTTIEISAQVVLLNAPDRRGAAVRRLARMYVARLAAAGWPSELLPAIELDHRVRVAAVALDLVLEERR